MPTSPRSKNWRINNAFRQIRNIIHRADVGIGPYDNLLRQSEHPSFTRGLFSAQTIPYWSSPTSIDHPCHCEAGKEVWIAGRGIAL